MNLVKILDIRSLICSCIGEYSLGSVCEVSVHFEYLGVDEILDQSGNACHSGMSLGITSPNDMSNDSSFSSTARKLNLGRCSF